MDSFYFQDLRSFYYADTIYKVHLTESEDHFHSRPKVPHHLHMGHVKRIWYLSPVRAAKLQASLRIHAVSPEPPLLAHTSSASRGIFRQKARSLAPLNGWACAEKNVMTECSKTQNSLDTPHIIEFLFSPHFNPYIKCIYSFY